MLLRELRERGYSGGYTILTDSLRPKRQMARAVAVRRFETPQAAQRDTTRLRASKCARGSPLACDGLLCRTGAVTLLFGHPKILTFGRSVLRRIAEDKPTVQRSPSHPGVAGEPVHLVADTVRLVRTTSTAHIPPLDRRHSTAADMVCLEIISSATDLTESVRIFDFAVPRQA